VVWAETAKAKKRTVNNVANMTKEKLTLQVSPNYDVFVTHGNTGVIARVINLDSEMHSSSPRRLITTVRHEIDEAVGEAEP
jgi:hypothetical protein